jgi:pimeloyl-ACP methyl ester carboxylesterase
MSQDPCQHFAIVPAAPTLAMLLATIAMAQPNFPTPKTFPPDAAMLKQIEAKTAELKKAIEGLPKSSPAEESIWADVAVYHKAAEWIQRHGEWFQKESGQQTLRVLDAGLERAKAASQGKTPWREVRGKPVIRGYRSAVDGSIQPVRVTLPAAFHNRSHAWRTDIVLHGRDGTLTEVKFLHAAEVAKPSDPPSQIVIEPYGRGNNAYRWAGETDVFDAVTRLFADNSPEQRSPIDQKRVVLRGFSMGGAGTWHIGLHYPCRFAVIGPGAGFTTTRGYIKNLPPQLPEYQEKCLRIYDAVDYADNAFNIPIVAYSGEIDPQKAAADNIVNQLKSFQEPFRLTHLVAPGLEHRMPPEWLAKAEAEYRKYVEPGRQTPERIRLVTYTPNYGQCDWLRIIALEHQYERAVVDARRTQDGFHVRTENVRVLSLTPCQADRPEEVRIDDHRLSLRGDQLLVKITGRWQVLEAMEFSRQVQTRPMKRHGLAGPIDDAFRSAFTVIAPQVARNSSPAAGYHQAAWQRFATEWDKWLRGRLPTGPRDNAHLVLFGDPQSNPAIAEVLPKLPITWSKDKLVVNGVEYDAKTHVPALIYPNPKNPAFYVVLNSGHTFHDADFRGTNALLYPRLGDWAVLKPTPTKDDPAAAEVVAAGLFDENWQFAPPSK